MFPIAAMVSRVLTSFLLFYCYATVLGIGEEDVVDLPGVQFQVNFKTYSGYLNANENGTWQMHYMSVSDFFEIETLVNNAMFDSYATVLQTFRRASTFINSFNSQLDNRHYFDRKLTSL